MGRSRTKNLNLPMHMKARERASGTYYYYCIDGKEVAVGTPVTRCPPHRSVRAALPHTAPASGHDAKAGYGEGMLRYLPWVRQVMAGDGV
jgi:hypothetical protein